MSDLSKVVDSRVTPADWERMAKHANISAAKLKTTVLEAFQRQTVEKPVAQTPLPTLSDVTRTGDCRSQSFEVDLVGILGLKGTFTLCGSSSDWTADLKLSLLVAGVEVWSTNYRFDPHNLSICLEPDLFIVKAKLCITLYIGTGKICLNISGNACVYNFEKWGWNCTDNFNITVFCIPLP